MNAPIGIGDNTYVVAAGETGARTRETSEPSGEGPQQRFADVLPLARAALERPSDQSPPDKTPSRDGRTEAEAAAKPPVRKGHPEQQQGTRDKDGSADPQIAAWPFARVVQAVTLRPAHAGSAPVKPAKPVTGQETHEPVVFGLVAQVTEQESKPKSSARGTTDAVSSSGQGQQKPKTQQTPSVPRAQNSPAGEQRPEGARAVTDTATRATTVKPQETMPPPQAVGGTVPAVTKAPAAATTGPAVQVAQTATPAVRAEQGDSKKGSVAKPPVAHPVNEAPQAGRHETSRPAASAPGDRARFVADKPEHPPAQKQAVNPPRATGSEIPSKPEKAPQGRPLPTEERPDKSAKPAATVRTDNSRGQATHVEGKEASSPGPKEAGAVVPELRVSPTGDATASSHRPAAPAQNPTDIGTPPARSPVRSVGEQILGSIQASAARGDRQVLIRLNPPELGTVLVRFQEQGDHLHGSLEVSNRETRRDIENALPHVVRALHEAGVQIRGVEVVTQDQTQRGPGGDHQPQDVWQQQPGAGQGREYSQGSPQTRWSQRAGGPGTVRPGTPDDEPRAAVGPGRIDVLL